MRVRLNNRRGMGLDPITSTVIPMIANNAVTAPVVSSVQYPLAAQYEFSSSTGLSNDPSLPSYLQNLTPAQLQVALAPDPTGENAYQMTLQTNDNYITSGLNCDDTDCGTGIPTNNNSASTLLLVSLFAIGFLTLEVFKR